MRKLTYLVGDQEVATLKEAHQLSSQTGLIIKPKYSDAEESKPLDMERLLKIKNHFIKKRMERIAKESN